MDNNTDVSKVQSSIGKHDPVCALSLRRIDPDSWPEDRLKWLWERMREQEHNHDDTTPDNYKLLRGLLYNLQSEWYEVGDIGIAAIDGIVPGVSAVVHFTTWGEMNFREYVGLANELFRDLFSRLQLNRLTAFVPAFNRNAVRMATFMGFKYEGELRKAYRKAGTFHNVQIFGLLREEFQRRGEVKH